MIETKKDNNLIQPFDLPEIKVPQQPRAEDLFGMFEVVDTAPTATPLAFLNQIKIYTNGSTYRLYWYDSTNNAWHYVTATA